MSSRGIITEWDSGTTGRSWFLGIGIDKYQHFTPLSNAVRDVRDIHALLTNNYDITEDCSILLTDDRANEGEIIAKFEYLAGELRPGDKILIYYSGHGHLNRLTGLAYWIPVDAKHNRTADYIPNSTIRDHIATLRARHVLLISDSCFSGSLLLRGGSRGTRAVEELDKISSRWALCSGREDEEVMDGMPGENSPFATSLLEALQDNSSDALNVSLLIDRVREQTAASAAQVPDGGPLRVDGHKGGQYIFRTRDSLATATSAKKETAEQYQETGHATISSEHANERNSRQGGHRYLRRRTFMMSVAVVIVALASLLIARNAGWLSSGPGTDNFNNGNKGFTEAQVIAFHSTSSVNENLWPADKRNRFKSGAPVFIYGQVICPVNAEFNIDFLVVVGDTSAVASYPLTVKGSSADPARFSRYHDFATPGIYLAQFVQVMNNDPANRKVYATTGFTVE